MIRGLIWQEVDEGDMKTLDALLPANAGERRTLADIIFAKLDSLEAGKTTVIHKSHQGMSLPSPCAESFLTCCALLSHVSELIYRDGT